MCPCTPEIVLDELEAHPDGLRLVDPPLDPRRKALLNAATADATVGTDHVQLLLAAPERATARLAATTRTQATRTELGPDDLGHNDGLPLEILESYHTISFLSRRD